MGDWYGNGYWNRPRSVERPKNLSCSRCKVEVPYDDFWVKKYKLCSTCKRKEYSDQEKRLKMGQRERPDAVSRKIEKDAIERKRMAIMELEEQKQREKLEQEKLLYMQKQREIRKEQMERAAAKEARKKEESARWYDPTPTKAQRSENVCTSCGKPIYISYGFPRCGCSD